MKTRAKVTQKKYCPPTFAIRLKLSVLRAVSEGRAAVMCTYTIQQCTVEYGAVAVPYIIQSYNRVPWRVGCRRILLHNVHY